MTAAATEERTTHSDIDDRVCHTFCCEPGYAFCGYREEKPELNNQPKRPPCSMCQWEVHEYIAYLIRKYGNRAIGWLAHREGVEHHPSCPNYRKDA